MGYYTGMKIEEKSSLTIDNLLELAKWKVQVSKKNCNFVMFFEIFS